MLSANQFCLVKLSNTRLYALRRLAAWVEGARQPQECGVQAAAPSAVLGARRTLYGGHRPLRQDGRRHKGVDAASAMEGMTEGQG